MIIKLKCDDCGAEEEVEVKDELHNLDLSLFNVFKSYASNNALIRIECAKCYNNFDVTKY